MASANACRFNVLLRLWDRRQSGRLYGFPITPHNIVPRAESLRRVDPWVTTGPAAPASPAAPAAGSCPGAAPAATIMSCHGMAWHRRRHRLCDGAHHAYMAALTKAERSATPHGLAQNHTGEPLQAGLGSAARNHSVTARAPSAPHGADPTDAYSSWPRAAC